MRDYRALWHFLKTNYGIIVQGDIAMNILKEIDTEGSNMRRARRLFRGEYVSGGPNSCWHYDGYDRGLISAFQEFSASINKTFVFAGGLGTSLSFYRVYIIS